MPYEISKANSLVWQLHSVVETKWGEKARNFVCEGSQKYCEQVRERLEKPSASMMLRPREGF